MVPDQSLDPAMAGIAMKSIDKVLEAFKQAGFAFDITRFEDRLVAQKLVFLMQELGVRLGYEKTYNFYLRGTYSPTLAKDLFGLTQSPDVVTSHLSHTEVQTARRLAETTKLRPHILEIMAAYRYLRKAGRDQDDSIRLIKTRKPFISPRDVTIGVSKCKTLWPEVTAEDIESLREEMEPWEAASPAPDPWD